MKNDTQDEGLKQSERRPVFVFLVFSQIVNSCNILSVRYDYHVELRGN